jgi:CBS domain containing-hemolysin-like protein
MFPREERAFDLGVTPRFGQFIGSLTMTDTLGSIAGQLPDASEIEGPNIVTEDGGFLVSGALNLSQIREHIGF